MWIAVAFDLSVITVEERKNYRSMRKKLLASGFSPIQKSFLWRWVENAEMADALIKRLQKFIPPQGNIIILRIPDTSFKQGKQIINGKNIALPEPPVPWLILI